MKIISADQRLAERRGAKILIAGPSGVGKTSQLRMLDPATTLFLDVEAGDLSVQDVPVDTLRLNDWTAARDSACRIGGPNPSYSPTACYSQAHFDAIGGPLDNLDKYETLFVDSITAVSRLSFRWAEQQPEAFSERSGKKDTRGTYGLHGREMIAWLNQLQHARGMNVVFVAILENTSPTNSTSLPGSCKWRARKLPASCPASSTRSSQCNGLISATAQRRRAPLSARRLIHGVIRPKIAPDGSSRSNNRTSVS